jgi:hypothetical protein
MKDARNKFWVHFVAESDSCNLQTEVMEKDLKDGNWRHDGLRVEIRGG